MVDKKQVDELVNFINEEIKKRLGEKLDAAYIVGSYAQGQISLSRPDVNWLLIHQEPVEDESRWILGEILTEAIDKYLDYFTVRPEMRPFKFGYPIRRGEEVFVNLSMVANAPTADEFKKKNAFMPEYVFEGYKAGRKLVWGEDVLGGITFEVNKRAILASAMGKIVDHKIQLDRIPLVYHLFKDTDLVFNEALSHGKNLSYFAVELVMTDKELKERKFLEYLADKNKLREIIKERLPEVGEAVEEIMTARDNYEEWKNDRERAKKIYLTASTLAEKLMRLWLQGTFKEE